MVDQAAFTACLKMGVLPALYQLVGIGYILGGLLFGIATLHAGILSRWAAGLLAVGSVLPVAFVLRRVAALIPPQIQHLAVMPVGIAVAWLGYALLTERRAHASEPSAGREAPSSVKPELSKFAGNCREWTSATWSLVSFDNPYLPAVSR